MTIETRDRSRGQRIAFYAIRTLFFGVIFGGLATNHPIWGWTLLALLIFWLVKKCMPWDLVPGPSADAADFATAAGFHAAGTESAAMNNPQTWHTADGHRNTRIPAAELLHTNG